MKNCCCYENGKCLWTKRYYENNIVPDCEKVKDCYYKQLQRAKEKIERIENICKSIKQVDNKVSIRLIEEILEDKFDIHYFLEKEEIELEGNNNEKIELGD